jgi:hypothetical protein
MLLDSPFREEDLQARVEALRAERDELARKLEATRGRVKAARRDSWSWWRFVAGFCIPPALMLLVLACLAWSTDAESARYRDRFSETHAQ